MHAEALCRFDVERVVVKEQHLSGNATEGIHDMLKRIHIRLYSPGEMRHEVAVEHRAKSLHNRPFRAGEG